MSKTEIVWSRARSRVEGSGAEVTVFIAAVPGGHLVSTSGPGGPGLCFVPGKLRAVEKLIARPDKREKKAKAGKARKAGKPSRPRKAKVASKRTRSAAK